MVDPPSSGVAGAVVVNGQLQDDSSANDTESALNSPPADNVTDVNPES